MSDERSPAAGPSRPETNPTAPSRPTRPVGGSATSPEQERLARARAARQVIAGSELRPPTSLSSQYATAEEGWLLPPQRTYLIVCGALLLLALAVYFVVGMGVASVIFFLLALTLLAGWLVF